MEKALHTGGAIVKFFGKRFWASALSALMLSSVMPVQAFALDDATSAASSVAAECCIF